MKFLAATFPENSRTKIGKVFRQVFATCFAKFWRNISPEFRSWGFSAQYYYLLRIEEAVDDPWIAKKEC